MKLRKSQHWRREWGEEGWLYFCCSTTRKGKFEKQPDQTEEEVGGKREHCERKEKRIKRARLIDHSGRGSAGEPAVSTPSGYQNKLVQSKRENFLGWLFYVMFVSLVIYSTSVASMLGKTLNFQFPPNTVTWVGMFEKFLAQRKALHV